VGWIAQRTPFSGREEEMQRTMALSEVAFSELRAIQMLRFFGSDADGFDWCGAGEDVLGE
jgi:hypothetical protein